MRSLSLAPRMNGGGDEAMISLFTAIPRRHTNRNPFLLSRVPESLLRHVRGLETDGLASLYVSADGKVNTGVAELVAAADRMQLADPAFRGDLRRMGPAELDEEARRHHRCGPGRQRDRLGARTVDDADARCQHDPALPLTGTSVSKHPASSSSRVKTRCRTGWTPDSSCRSCC